MALMKETRDRLAHGIQKYILEGQISEEFDRWDPASWRDKFCYDFIYNADKRIGYNRDDPPAVSSVIRTERRITALEQIAREAQYSVRVVIEWEIYEYRTGGWR